MNKKTISKLAFIALLILTVSGCKQIRQMKNFAKCQFRMTTLENARLAGVNIQGIKKMSDIKFVDAGILTAAYLSGNLPLSFTLNLEAKNPNAQPAAMNRMQWIAFIDEIEISTGALEQRIAVPANGGTAKIPVNIRANLKEILNNKTKDSIMNFGLNLSGAGNAPSRVGIKIKPSIMVGQKAVNYPGFITVKKEFGS